MKTSDDHKTTFSYKAPEALSIALIGDFTHWQRDPIPLQRRADGIWQTSIVVGPGKHHYTFIIDGKWRADEEYTVRVSEKPSPFAVCCEA